MLTALVTAAPYIGPEMPVSESIYAEQIGEQGGQDIAFDGTNYLVAWCDSRNDDGFLSGEWRQVYGTRVSPTGEVIDKSGFFIGGEFRIDSGYPCTISIAFNGANYLVVWQNEASIMTARVSPEAEILDPEGLVVSTDGRYPDVASDGDNYLVVWENTSEVQGVRVDFAGTILDADDILLAAESSRPFVDFDGMNYRVAWGAGYTARVDTDGQVLDIPVIQLAQVDGVSDLACHDGDCLLVWSDTIVEAVLLNADGTENGAPFVVGDVPSQATFSSVAYGDGLYLVSWVDERNYIETPDAWSSDIYSARVTADGTVLDPSGIAVRSSADQWCLGSTVASDGENFIVAWTSYPLSEELNRWEAPAGVHGDIITSTAVIQEEKEIVISSDLAWQIAPSVAFNGNDYFVVWTELRNYWESRGNIFASRITRDGMFAQIFADSVDSILEDHPQHDLFPVIEYGNGVLLVVWNNSFSASYSDANKNCLYVARMSSDGVMLDAAPHELSCTINAMEDNKATVAFDGTDFLVVWNDYRTPQEDNPYPAFYARRIPAHGTIPNEEAVFLSGGESNQYAMTMDLKCDDQNCLFVWSSEGSVRAMHIAPDMSILDPEGIVVSSAGSYPLMAFDGDNYLIVWGYNYIRMRPDGTILDSPARTIPFDGDYYKSPLALVFDGFNYLLVFRSSFEEVKLDLSGWRISPEGTVIGQEFIIADAPEDERMSRSVATAGDGTAIIAYQRSRQEPNEHHWSRTDRIKYRIFYSGVEGARCEEQAHCGDGLVCTANICIDPNAPDDIIEGEDDIQPDETMTDSDALIEEPEETVDTDNDFPPFDYDFADYGKDGHPACSCSVVF